MAVGGEDDGEAAMFLDAPYDRSPACKAHPVRFLGPSRPALRQNVLASPVAASAVLDALPTSAPSSEPRLTLSPPQTRVRLGQATHVLANVELACDTADEPSPVHQGPTPRIRPGTPVRQSAGTAHAHTLVVEGTRLSLSREPPSATHRGVPDMDLVYL